MTEQLRASLAIAANASKALDMMLGTLLEDLRHGGRPGEAAISALNWLSDVASSATEAATELADEVPPRSPVLPEIASVLAAVRAIPPVGPVTLVEG